MHRAMEREHCMSRNSGGRIQTHAVGLTRSTNRGYLPATITRLMISEESRSFAKISLGYRWIYRQPQP